MKINLFIIFIALATAPLCAALGSCSDKSIFEDTTFKLNSINSDVNLAYNGDASCATLRPDSTEDGKICCYVKVKFENKDLDETFTQKGCYEFDATDSILNDEFGEFKDIVEDQIERSNDVDVKDLSIDCNSKFLHLTGIALILFLL